MISNFSLSMVAVFVLIFVYKYTVTVADTPKWYQRLSVSPKFGEYLYYLGIYSLVLMFIINIVVSVLWVPSKSMEPNYKADSYILTNPLSFGIINPFTERHFNAPDISELKRGDVVISRFPFSPTVTFLKRVVALPGDAIEITNEGITINNRPHLFEHLAGDLYQIELNESTYRVKIDSDKTMLEQSRLVIPKGHVYLLGDNLTHSSDSRTLGPIPIAALLAKPR